MIVEFRVKNHYIILGKFWGTVCTLHLWAKGIFLNFYENNWQLILPFVSWISFLPWSLDKTFPNKSHCLFKLRVCKKMFLKPEAITSSTELAVHPYAILLHWGFCLLSKVLCHMFWNNWIKSNCMAKLVITLMWYFLHLLFLEDSWMTGFP